MDSQRARDALRPGPTRAAAVSLGTPDTPVRPLAPAPSGGPVRSVYVHAPFCARRCSYCDFAIHVAPSPDPGSWIEALEGELRAVEEDGRFAPAARLETVYVGGGTPSVLGPDALEALSRVLGSERLGEDDVEWTAEANPESFTPEVARSWRATGVNRVSLGLQSFHPGALRWMGRLHGPDEARRAVAVARDAGFESLSVDLIFGLPPRLGRSWTADLERVLALGVPHVSLYGLTVEPHTPLARAVAEGREAVADEERYREQFLEATEAFSAAGYEHYELSNFARPGHASRHNRVYWEGASYLGLGNAAHSYRHPVRRWNLRDWREYSTVARQGRLPVDESEALDAAAHRLERVWLGLRTNRGLALDSLPDAGRSLVRRWATRGLAETDDAVVRLTPEGWLVIDRLVVELDARFSEPEPRTEEGDREPSEDRRSGRRKHPGEGRASRSGARLTRTDAGVDLPGRSE